MARTRQFKNYRGGYLQQGAVMGMVHFSKLLSADNQVVNPNKGSLCFLSSDNTTATNRTFTLLDGQIKGQRFTLNFNVGSSYTCDLQSTGNVTLVEAWQPTQYEILELMWDGAEWCEIARSTTGIVAGSIVNADINASAAIAFSKLATLTDGNILVGNGSNVAASVAMSGDVAIINTGATTIQAGAVDSAMISDVDSALKCAVATVAYTDLTGAGDGVAYVSGGTLPDNAVVVKCWYEVTTTFAGDGDDGSLLSIGIEDQDNDQVVAVAISAMGDVWDAGGFVECISDDIDDPSKFVKNTASRQIAVTWDSGGSDTTLSAGAMKVFALYLVAG